MRPGATPVPIPNTMVKTGTADDTALATVWESRWLPAFLIWGCSSVGRAPALQAGGHGFESHHLHQRTKSALTTRGDLEETPKFIPDGKVGLKFLTKKE